MTIGERFIEESVSPGDSQMSHDERFFRAASSEVRELPWRTGRELLLCDDATIVEPHGRFRLPRSPRSGSRVPLWIPLAGETRPQSGPVYQVVAAGALHLDRVRAESSVHYLPDLIVVLGSRRRRVLGSLDRLNPSALRHLERSLGKAVLRASAAELFPTDDVPDATTESLPPAARTILDTIQDAATGTVHVASFEKRGAGPLISLLEQGGHITVFRSGLIISRSTEEKLRLLLQSQADAPDGRDHIDPRTAAALWQCSVGLARELLEDFARQGLLDRQAGGKYKMINHG